MKNIRFAELSYTQISKLAKLEVGRHVISEADIKKVEEILKLNEINDCDELTAIRNSVVLNLGDLAEQFGEYDMKKAMQIETNESGIVAVIDSKLFKLGGIY